MTSTTTTIPAERTRFLAEVLDGLLARPKTLPCKYFYDRRGSRLFDAICELDEYYLTRTELAIMRRHVAAMADALGPDCTLIEYGSGSSIKTRLLLDALGPDACYVPVDISGDHLFETAAALRASYPDTAIHPVRADFTRPFKLPLAGGRRVVYFPGSTIGNFTRPQAVALLRNVARLVGRGGGLLVGVDLWKSPTVLHAAYDDADGVTAEFNLNLLAHINKDLGADFDLAAFDHEARVNPAERRVEMHLVSHHRQNVTIDGTQIAFARGESIHTENSHKYTLSQFQTLAEMAGLVRREIWTDLRQYFSVQYLTAH
jgi:dimethylhistidine N-methyltransferase